MTYLTLGLVLGYLFLAFALFFMQRKILYVPSVGALYPMDSSLIGAETVQLETADGLRLSAWYAPPAKPDWPTIIYFHGNAGNLRDRASRYKMLMDKGFGVLALSYRGYGGNPGTPTEQGLYADARAAVKFALTKEPNAKKLLFYGESLGTGVAIQMASEHAPGALVLEAPYTSVAARAQEIYFFVPTNLLLRDRFDSIGKIRTIHAPVLIFHGEKDAVMPAHHGKKLLEAANEPKKGVFFKDNGHTDFALGEIGILVEDWAREHGMLPES